jgi:hypothetical protein
LLRRHAGTSYSQCRRCCGTTRRSYARRHRTATSASDCAPVPAAPLASLSGSTLTLAPLPPLSSAAISLSLNTCRRAGQGVPDAGGRRQIHRGPPAGRLGGGGVRQHQRGAACSPPALQRAPETHERVRVPGVLVLHGPTLARLHRRAAVSPSAPPPPGARTSSSGPCTGQRDDVGH